MNTNDNRQAYTAGLRKLADLLDKHPELPLPFTGTRPTATLMWIETRDGVRERAQAFIRAIPGTVTKEVRDDRLDLTGAIDGLHVEMITNRDDLCERVVLGQREVTREVPDPTVEIPMVTTTVVEDIVEWRCAPVLAGGAS